MRAIDGQTFTNFAATTAKFTLAGGRYAFVYSAGTWGTMQLNVLSADGSTWVPATANPWSANGSDLLDLPSATYQIAAGDSLAGGYLFAQRVPVGE